MFASLEQTTQIAKTFRSGIFSLVGSFKGLMSNYELNKKSALHISPKKCNFTSLSRSDQAESKVQRDARCMKIYSARIPIIQVRAYRTFNSSQLAYRITQQSTYLQ